MSLQGPATGAAQPPLDPSPPMAWTTSVLLSPHLSLPSVRARERLAHGEKLLRAGVGGAAALQDEKTCAHLAPGTISRDWAPHLQASGGWAVKATGCAMLLLVPGLGELMGGKTGS